MSQGDRPFVFYPFALERGPAQWLWSGLRWHCSWRASQSEASTALARTHALCIIARVLRMQREFLNETFADSRQPAADRGESRPESEGFLSRTP